jgi:hypothetical protein
MSRAETGKIAPRPSFPIASGCHSARALINPAIVHWFLFVDACLNSAHDSAMQTAQPVKRGGRRIGAGRPKGTYKYGEPTVPLRVLAKLVGEVNALCGKAPRKLPLFVMVNPTKPLN